MQQKQTAARRMKAGHSRWILGADMSSQKEAQSAAELLPLRLSTLTSVCWRSWEIRGHLTPTLFRKTSLRIIILERHPNIWQAADILLRKNRSF